jgi:hypothetical protein
LTIGGQHGARAYRIVGQVAVLVQINDELVIALAVAFGFIHAIQEGGSSRQVATNAVERMPGHCLGFFP